MYMKQTAVEWLINKLDGENHLAINEINRVVEQAKAMEKNQLESLKDFDTWKEWKNTDKINSNMRDSIVNSVLMQFKERSSVGIEKYGTTLDRQDLSTLEWLIHAQQEAMDFVLYLEKLKQEYENN